MCVARFASSVEYSGDVGAGGMADNETEGLRSPREILERIGIKTSATLIGARGGGCGSMIFTIVLGNLEKQSVLE